MEHTVIERSIRDRFPDPKALPKNYYSILRFLEIRSFKQNGDTKSSDSKIATLLGISPKTVNRGLKRLELDGYIVRFTEFRVGTNSKCSSRNNFYSIRTIRCCRIFLMNGCKSLKTQELGWKTDCSARLKTIECPMSFKSITKTEIVWTPFGHQTKTVDGKGWNNRDAIERFVYDPSLRDMYERFAEWRSVGDERASQTIGYKEINV